MTAVFWHIASPDQPIVSLTLPPKLFYVRHRNSQAYATDDGGFIARAPDRDIREEEELKRNAEMHFDWYTRDWESCFVSAFGDQVHAERWGRRPCHWQAVKVYELDTLKLPPGTLVLNAFMLCTSLGIEHQFHDKKDEYLFYRGIPGSCVESSWDPRVYCPQVQFPPMQFPSSWFQVVDASERAQTLHKVQLAVSHRDKETHQEHGVEGEHEKPIRSVAHARREQKRQREEYERQKSAETSTDTILDPDVNDLAGQMEVLDLETNLDNHTSTSHNTPSNTTPKSTTTAAATTTPNNSASTTATLQRNLNELSMHSTEISGAMGKFVDLLRESDAETVPVVSVLELMSLLGRSMAKLSTVATSIDVFLAYRDKSPLPSTGTTRSPNTSNTLQVGSLVETLDTRESHTTPNTTRNPAANTIPNTATPTATTEAGSPAAGVASGPFSASQIRAMRRAQRETEERRRESLGGLKEKDKEAEGQSGGKVPRVR